jgi:glycosyltransferase involved in cell wall biosynthesis
MTANKLGLVSILVATRDRRSWLDACLRSVLAQTYRDLEIIVSDDGSSDDTLDLVRSLERADSRVGLITGNPSPGVFSNFEYLLQHASGDSVCFVGDDDLLQPTFVEALARPLERGEAQIAYSWFDVIDERGAVRPDQMRILDLYHRVGETKPGIQTDPIANALRGQLWLGACLYDATTIRQLRFDASCGSAADLDLALRAAERCAIWFVSDRLWRYRDHARTISRGGRLEASKSAVAVLERRRYSRPEHEGLRRAQLRRHLLVVAWLSVAGERRLARNALERYLRNGGSAVDPRFMLTLAVGLLPAGVRGFVSSAINTIRRRGGSHQRHVMSP